MFKLLCKLKQVKVKLKSFHKEEFAGISSRTNQARSELDSIEKSLKDSSSNDLLNQEAACIESLRIWLRVDEIALRQKSRIQWLQVGDYNHQYFFSSVTERSRMKRISVLYDDNGTKLVEP